MGFVLACTHFAVTLTPVSATTVQDQSNPGPDINGVLFEGTDRVAQIFRAGISGQLTKITLWGCNQLDVVDSMRIEIYQAIPAPPSATPPVLPSTIIGEATVSGAELVTIPDNSNCTLPIPSFDVSLDSPAPIIAGNLYAFVVSATTSSLPGGLRLRGSAITTYPDGNRADSSDFGATWNARIDRNLLFTTFDDIGSPSPEPDPILQQFGKPASGTCTDTAPPHTQLPGAPSGGWGESWAQWANDGNGGAVCTRTLIYRTALSRWIVD
jgi:hypothetical protein